MARVRATPVFLKRLGGELCRGKRTASISGESLQSLSTEQKGGKEHPPKEANLSLAKEEFLVYRAGGKGGVRIFTAGARASFYTIQSKSTLGSTTAPKVQYIILSAVLPCHSADL